MNFILLSAYFDECINYQKLRETLKCTPSKIHLNNTLTESTEERKHFDFHTFVPNECKRSERK